MRAASRIGRASSDGELAEYSGSSKLTATWLIAAKAADAKKAKLIKKGEVGRKYTVTGIALTAGAREAILAAGGSVE